jgi:enoyl-CoA hydratase/carnithine racemase
MNRANIEPKTLKCERHGAVAVLTLARPAKRNAIDDATALGIERFFDHLEPDVHAVVMQGEGDHFSAGLDLNEMLETPVYEGIHHSRLWHRIFDKIEFGRVPVIAVLKGAVVGGGLELACAAHVRVAERSAFYALPEGQRGIFVGGGAAVRLSRLIGVARMTDMMLTGRSYNAEEGNALGISTYLADNGKGFAKALELAATAAKNRPVTNFAILNVLPRAAEGDRATAYLLEALMAGIAQGDEEAKQRLRDFLEKRDRR